MLNALIFQYDEPRRSRYKRELKSDRGTFHHSTYSPDEEKSMKMTYSKLLAIALTSFVSAGSMADEVDSSFVLKRIQDRGVINMGHREASVPFSYIGDDGKPQGYSVDLCHKIIDRIKEVTGKSDLEVKYVRLPPRLALH